MKIGSNSKNPFVLPTLIAGFSLILAGRMTAQTFTTLHSFTTPSSLPPYGNSDGANPIASLILSGNILYGTAYFGGSSGDGAVFRMKTDGTGFTNLYSFTPLSNPYSGTNSDGANPNRLILSGNILYGTASGGGSSGDGAVFSVSTDGTGFTNLYSFTRRSNGGAFPRAALTLSGKTLYGTASGGGSSGDGAVFSVSADGTGFTNLYSFTPSSNRTNSDGANPNSGLILSDNTLYGTASAGGSSGDGAVFRMKTDGTGFTNLYSFTGPSDGTFPTAALILSGNILYGTAYFGGSSNDGTVFAINTDGTGFTNLHSFSGGDGTFPRSALVLSGNILYGTTVAGGSSGNGTVFAVNTDGTGFANLYSFTTVSGIFPSITNSDGANPNSGLILSGNTPNHDGETQGFAKVPSGFR